MFYVIHQPSLICSCALISVQWFKHIIENSRNKELTSFKLLAVLSNIVKSGTVLLCPFLM